MGVYVVGMHRSGTSALAGLVSALCGLPAGRLAVESNPAGQWERPDLRPALEMALAWNRATWAHPPAEMARLSMPAPLLAYASRVFARHCTEPFLWKDPRLCVTIDHWLSLPQPPPRIIVIHREPLPVAESLRQRNRWPLERGLALWERSNRNALRRLEGRDVFALANRTLLADPERVVTELAQWLDCPEGDGDEGQPGSGSRSRAVATIERQGSPSRHLEPAPPDPDRPAVVTAEQWALVDRLARAHGPTRLDLDGVGPESPSTGPALGSPGPGELGRRMARAVVAIPRRHTLEVAG